MRQFDFLNDPHEKNNLGQVLLCLCKMENNYWTKLRYTPQDDRNCSYGHQHSWMNNIYNCTELYLR